MCLSRPLCDIVAIFHFVIMIIMKVTESALSLSMFSSSPIARVCVALDRVRKSDWREGAVYCFKIESFNCPACLALPAATAGAAQLVKQELST